MNDQSQIVPFVFEDQLVRTVIIDGEPWFVAKDVCAALLLKGDAGQHTRRLPDDERDTLILKQGTSGNPTTVVVSEAGLYRLIFRSDKPEAKRFQDFIFREVLPALRKTGTYTVPGREAEAPAVDPQSMAELETIRTRLDMVREARQSFGRGAAQQVWRDCGLPVTPAMQWGGAASADRVGRGRLALRFLMMAAPDDGGSFGGRVLAGDRLAVIGLRLVPEAGALAVSNTHPAIYRAFEDSPFAGDWRLALRGIPGARAADSGLYFGRSKTRCTLIPMSEVNDVLGSEVRS